MMHRGFLLALLLCSAPPALAADYESPQALKRHVEALLKSRYAERYSQAQLENNVEIEVSNLDARLKLTKCSQPIDSSVAVPRAYGNNLTVKLACNGAQRWTIYVPARIHVYADIAVANRNLQRGDILDQSDVKFVRMNTSAGGSGHIEDPQRLLGKELKRPLRSGEPVRLSHLTAAEIIKRGDRVQLEARNKSVSVVVGATALSDGRMGDQIRVENSNSKQVVDATVVGPGRVEIGL